MPRRPVNSDRCPDFNIMVLQTVYGRFGRGWQAPRMYILKHAATKTFRAPSRAIPNCQCGPTAAYRCPIPAALEYRCGGPRHPKSRSAKTAFPGRISVPVPSFAGSLTEFGEAHRAKTIRSATARSIGCNPARAYMIRDVALTRETAMKGGGLGLISIYERIKLVNGALSIDSQINPSASIHARVAFNPGE